MSHYFKLFFLCLIITIGIVSLYILVGPCILTLKWMPVHCSDKEILDFIVSRSQHISLATTVVSSITTLALVLLFKKEKGKGSPIRGSGKGSEYQPARKRNL